MNHYLPNCRSCICFAVKISLFLSATLFCDQASAQLHKKDYLKQEKNTGKHKSRFSPPLAKTSTPRVTRKTDLATVNFKPDTVIRKKPDEKKPEDRKDVKAKPVSFNKDSVLKINALPNRWRKD